MIKRKHTIRVDNICFKRISVPSEVKVYEVKVRLNEVPFYCKLTDVGARTYLVFYTKKQNLFSNPYSLPLHVSDLSNLTITIWTNTIECPPFEVEGCTGCTDCSRPVEETAVPIYDLAFRDLDGELYSPKIKYTMQKCRLDTKYYSNFLFFKKGYEPCKRYSR